MMLPSVILAGLAFFSADTWTDHDGDEPYGDFTVSGGVAANVRSYQPGVAVVDPWMPSGNTATDYFVTDHLGTTRGLTLPGGTPVDGRVAPGRAVFHLWGAIETHRIPFAFDR